MEAILATNGLMHSAVGLSETDLVAQKSGGLQKPAHLNLVSKSLKNSKPPALMNDYIILAVFAAGPVPDFAAGAITSLKHYSNVL